MDEDQSNPHSKIIPINATVIKTDPVAVSSMYKFMRPCNSPPARIEVDCPQSPKVYRRGSRQHVITLDCHVSGDQIKGLISKQKSKGCLQTRTPSYCQDLVANALSTDTHGLADYENKSICTEEIHQSKICANSADEDSWSCAENRSKSPENLSKSPLYNSVGNDRYGSQSICHQRCVIDCKEYCKIPPKSRQSQQSNNISPGRFLHSNESSIICESLKSSSIKQSKFHGKPELLESKKTKCIQTQSSPLTHAGINCGPEIQHQQYYYGRCDKTSLASGQTQKQKSKSPCQNISIPFIDTLGNLQRCVEQRIMAGTHSPVTPNKEERGIYQKVPERNMLSQQESKNIHSYKHCHPIARIVYENASVRQSPKTVPPREMSPCRLSEPYGKSNAFSKQRSDQRLSYSPKHTKYSTPTTCNRQCSIDKFQRHSMIFLTKPSEQNMRVDTSPYMSPCRSIENLFESRLHPTVKSPVRSTMNISEQHSNERFMGVLSPRKSYPIPRHNSEEEVYVESKSSKKSIFIRNQPSEEGLNKSAMYIQKSISPTSNRVPANDTIMSPRQTVKDSSHVSRRFSDEEMSVGFTQSRESISPINIHTSDEEFITSTWKTQKRADPESRRPTEEEMEIGAKQSKKSIIPPSDEDIRISSRRTQKSIIPISTHASAEDSALSPERSHSNIVGIGARKSRKVALPAGKQPYDEDIIVSERTQQSIILASRSASEEDMVMSPINRRASDDDISMDTRLRKKSTFSSSTHAPDKDEEIVSASQSRKSIYPASKVYSDEDIYLGRISPQKSNQPSGEIEIGKSPDESIHTSRRTTSKTTSIKSALKQNSPGSSSPVKVVSVDGAVAVSDSFEKDEMNRTYDEEELEGNEIILEQQPSSESLPRTTIERHTHFIASSASAEKWPPSQQTSKHTFSQQRKNTEDTYPIIKSTQVSNQIEKSSTQANETFDQIEHGTKFTKSGTLNQIDDRAISRSSVERPIQRQESISISKATPSTRGPMNQIEHVFNTTESGTLNQPDDISRRSSDARSTQRPESTSVSKTIFSTRGTMNQIDHGTYATESGTLKLQDDTTFPRKSSAARSTLQPESIAFSKAIKSGMLNQPDDNTFSRRNSAAGSTQRPESISISKATSSAHGTVYQIEHGTFNQPDDTTFSKRSSSERATQSQVRASITKHRSTEAFSKSSTQEDGSFFTAAMNEDEFETDFKVNGRSTEKLQITNTLDSDEARNLLPTEYNSSIHTIPPSSGKHSKDQQYEKGSLGDLDIPPERISSDDPGKGTKKKNKKKKGSDGNVGDGKQTKKNKKKKGKAENEEEIDNAAEDDPGELPHTDDMHDPYIESNTEYLSFPKNTGAEQTSLFVEAETTENEMKTPLTNTEDTEAILQQIFLESPGDAATVEITEMESAIASEADKGSQRKSSVGVKENEVAASESIHKVPVDHASRLNSVEIPHETDLSETTPLLEVHDEDGDVADEPAKGGKKKKKNTKKKKEKKKGKKGDDGPSPGVSDEDLQTNQNRQTEGSSLSTDNVDTEFLSPVSSSHNINSESAYYSVKD